MSPLAPETPDSLSFCLDLLATTHYSGIDDYLAGEPDFIKAVAYGDHSKHVIGEDYEPLYMPIPFPAGFSSSQALVLPDKENTPHFRWTAAWALSADPIFNALERQTQRLSEVLLETFQDASTPADSSKSIEIAAV